jgi:hypothetical protein
VLLGLTYGEFGLVAFIVAAILTARFWPRLGQWVVGQIAPADRSDTP